ncbi:MAG TPA: histone deacetylase [Candidatus Sulfopaludibacter sp.]|nr:histone deacetylase [Candidatus Sulfopaludibacter sp.]
MKIITDERCAGYSSYGHPENPRRVMATTAHLKGQTELPLLWAAPGTVSEGQILRAHLPEHLVRLKIPEDFDADTPFYENINDYARASVAAALDALAAARNGENVFSLMRPPGHHALRDRAMGFCYLNNVAIAALEAVAAGAKRVAVFDFDVHHGNGTEAILLDQPCVAFFSIHLYPFYPGTGGANVGKNCFNYPVAPCTPCESYRAALAQALDDLKKFKPELVAVSAGFDAYVRDPLGGGVLELEDFHWLGQSLRAFGVPMFSVLEGGYSRDLPELVFAYLKGVEGK